MSILPHSDALSYVEPQGRTPSTLRGAPLSAIVWYKSLLLEKGRSPDRLCHSSEVRQLDVFLSHSWSGNGREKQLAVMMSFYISFASKVMIASTLAVTSLMLACSLSSPLYTFVTAFNLTGLICVLFIAPLFYHRRIVVFLDKCCITEADPIGGMHGISMLSEYLRRSDKLVIFWSSDYFNRLWCIYELAMFLGTHSIEDVVTVHIKHVKMCCAMLSYDFIYIFVSSALMYLESLGREDFYPLHIVRILMGFVMAILTAEIAHEVSEEAQRFRQTLDGLDIEKAKCSDADDEAALKRSIADCYGSLQSFEAVLRGIWLRLENDNGLPPWLISETALRVLSLPYILLYRSTIIRILDQHMLHFNEAVSSGYPIPVFEELVIAVAKSFGAMLLVGLMCCRAPLLMVIGTKLATYKGWLLADVRRFVLIVVCFVYCNVEDIRTLLLLCRMPSPLMVVSGPSGYLKWALTISLFVISIFIVHRTYKSDLPANLR